MRRESYGLFLFLRVYDLIEPTTRLNAAEHSRWRTPPHAETSRGRLTACGTAPDSVAGSCSAAQLGIAAVM
jgi:hypothetical protein